EFLAAKQIAPVGVDLHSGAACEGLGPRAVEVTDRDHVRTVQRFDDPLVRLRYPSGPDDAHSYVVHAGLPRFAVITLQRTYQVCGLRGVPGQTSVGDRNAHVGDSGTTGEGPETREDHRDRGRSAEASARTAFHCRVGPGPAHALRRHLGPGAH